MALPGVVSITNGMNLLLAEDQETTHVAVNNIRPYHNHPYSVETDTQEFEELVESIKTKGVLMPLIVRRNSDPAFSEEYECIVGHRRLAAAKAAGLAAVPTFVMNYGDDDADIVMVDSNLHRENIKPSEKANAYRIKYDAMKRQAGRRKKIDVEGNEKNADQVGPNSRTSAKIAQESPDSARQIMRYLRLTELIPPLLKKVDSGQIPFTTAVDLSYVRSMGQGMINAVLDIEGIKLKPDQVKDLRVLDEKDELDKDSVYYVIKGRKLEEKAAKEEAKAAVPKTAPLKKLFKFPKSYKGSTDEMRDLIQQLLDKHFRDLERTGEK